MSNLLKPIEKGMRVGVANFTSLGSIVKRLRQNVYLVKLDDGRELSINRNQLSQWDEKAGRCFSFPK